MHAPGAEVRPLRQMSGDAEFNEVYLTDVRIPDAMRVGDPGLGWRVARTTLMNERVSIGGVVQPRGSGPIARLVHAWKALPPDRRDAARADAVSKLWVDAEVLRLGNLRAQQLREVGTPGPEGSVLKLAGALLDQRIADQIVDLLGPAGMLHPDYDGPNKHGRATAVTGLLGAQSLTIAGGTTEIQKNILGERVLGLPREPQADKGVVWSHIPRGA